MFFDNEASDTTSNGRVDIDDGKCRTPYHGSRLTHVGCNLNKVQTSTPLSVAFFSEPNQTIIQNAIRNKVWRATQKVIGTQDAMQLQIIMRSIFLQHARHSVSIPVPQQIQELNDRVLEYCVPRVSSNVQQYLHYKKDVSTLPTPFDHAMNMSQKGSKTLQTHPFV